MSHDHGGVRAGARHQRALIITFAAGGVWLSGASSPDLIVGVLVAAVFLCSAGSIVRAAWPQFHDSEPARSDDEGPAR